MSVPCPTCLACCPATSFSPSPCLWVFTPSARVPPSLPSPWLLPSSPSREPPGQQSPTEYSDKGVVFPPLPAPLGFGLPGHQSRMTGAHRGQSTKASSLLRTTKQQGATTTHPSRKDPPRVCSCWTRGPPRPSVFSSAPHSLTLLVTPAPLLYL